MGTKIGASKAHLALAEPDSHLLFGVGIGAFIQDLLGLGERAQGQYGAGQECADSAFGGDFEHMRIRLRGMERSPY